MSLRATSTFASRGDVGRFVANKITPGVRASVEASAEYVLDQAKQLVPVDTGELRDSGTTRIADTDKSVVGTVEFTADHAGYIEYGTGVRGAEGPMPGPYPYNESWPGMEAQPYLRPAMDSARDVIREIFASNIAVRLHE